MFSSASIKNDGDENHALTQLVITGDVVAQFYDDTWFALSPSHDPAAMESIQSSKRTIERVVDLKHFIANHEDLTIAM